MTTLGFSRRPDHNHSHVVCLARPHPTRGALLCPHGLELRCRRRDLSTCSKMVVRLNTVGRHWARIEGMPPPCRHLLLHVCPTARRHQCPCSLRVNGSIFRFLDRLVSNRQLSPQRQVPALGSEIVLLSRVQSAVHPFDVVLQPSNRCLRADLNTPAVVHS